MVRLLLLGALLVAASAATAAASIAQDGQCDYLGDWRDQLTPFTHGPGRSVYATAGACASVAIERLGPATWHWVLRVDSAQFSSTDYQVVWGHAEDDGGGFTSTFTCMRGACALGPLEGTVTDPYATQSCALAVVLKDGIMQRVARACA